MKIFIYFIVGMTCVLSSCNAQPSSKKTKETSLSKIAPLSIGDTVPDVVFHHMLNYKDSTARLSDFKGKLVILDFFATWCGSCIEALPKLDSLQHAFDRRIQIFVITRQPTEMIKTFLHKNPNGGHISLPFVASDSLLNTYFPHKLIPHEVWMNKMQKIVAITEYYYVTATNIQKLLDGKPADLPLKKDIMKFSVKRSLAEDYSIQRRPAFTSTFGKFLKGLPAMTLRDKNGKRIRFLATNSTIISLYRNVFPRLQNRIIVEVKDSSRFFKDHDQPFDRWAANNCFCYEITAPPSTTQKTLHQYMLQDLNRYLRLYGHKEKRMVKCWVLIRIGEEKAMYKSHGGKPKIAYAEKLPVKIFKNLTIKKFIDAMNFQAPGNLPTPIVINETHYNGPIDLELEIDNIHDMPAMRKALQSYGLDLVPVKRKLEMFVISDNINKMAASKAVHNL